MHNITSLYTGTTTTKAFSSILFYRNSNIDPSFALDKNDVLSVLLASAKVNGVNSSVKIPLLQDIHGPDSTSRISCPITPRPSFEEKQATTKNACHTSPSLNISTLLACRVQPLLYAPLPNFRPGFSPFNGCSNESENCFGREWRDHAQSIAS